MSRRPMQPPIGLFLLVIAGLIGLQAVVLYVFGQPPICTCGVIRLWVGNVLSPENSQQFLDWYSFSHIVHGIALYFLLWLIAPRTPVLLRLTLAIGLEVGWEILENTPFIIDRYRQQALPQGYSGDSIVNSLSDTCLAILGFLLARFLPVWGSAGVVVALELFVGVMIHDNLTLNIIQLIHRSRRFRTGKQAGDARPRPAMPAPGHVRGDTDFLDYRYSSDRRHSRDGINSRFGLGAAVTLWYQPAIAQIADASSTASNRRDVFHRHPHGNW